MRIYYNRRSAVFKSRLRLTRESLLTNKDDRGTGRADVYLIRLHLHRSRISHEVTKQRISLEGNGHGHEPDPFDRLLGSMRNESHPGICLDSIGRCVHADLFEPGISAPAYPQRALEELPSDALCWNGSATKKRAI